MFGTIQPRGLFGATATPAFGQSQQPGSNGSAIVKYQPPHGTDILLKGDTSHPVKTIYHCITAMKEYELKSLEEIRIEDYTANMFGTTRPSGLFRGQQAPAFGSTAPTQQPGFGAFAHQQQANNNPFRSLLQQYSSVFGQPSTLPFGAAKSAATFGFGSPQPQTALFGQANASTTANTSFGGFGTNATSGVVFGATATPAFGQSKQSGANGSAIVKYQPPHGIDTLMKGDTSHVIAIYHCITAMKEYELKSLEEIRIEDYTANRRSMLDWIGSLKKTAHSSVVECILGVEKRLLNYFLNPKYRNQKFYINNEKKKLLNARFLSIKPPAYIVRKPRSMDRKANFTASERKTLFLYYLPVCLLGVIPMKYVKHVQHFSAAMYILLRESIPEKEVNKAEMLMITFVKEHQILFGRFERNNGCLLKLVNGIKDVLLQVSTKYTLANALSKNNEKRNVQNIILLGRKVKVVEKILRVFNIESLKTLNFSNISLYVHRRIQLGQTIYTSLLYSKQKKSINYFIGLKDDTFGMAKFYFEYENKIFVLMREFLSIDNTNHILKVEKTNQIIMAPIDDIVVKYLYMKIGLNEYIVSEPNPYDNE